MPRYSYELSHEQDGAFVPVDETIRVTASNTDEAAALAQARVEQLQSERGGCWAASLTS